MFFIHILITGCACRLYFSNIVINNKVMGRYIAFLRAVNVGGRVVKMDELKKIFAMPGIKNIATYIQSGNVVFDAGGEKEAIKEKIEKKLLKALGYEVVVFLKTFDEVRDIIKRVPYTKKQVEEMAVHISMLSEAPDKEGLKFVQDFIAPDEQVKVSGVEAYILVPKNSFGNSKLGKVNMEKKLKVTATTRNWATMNKVLALE